MNTMADQIMDDFDAVDLDLWELDPLSLRRVILQGTSGIHGLVGQTQPKHKDALTYDIRDQLGPPTKENQPESKTQNDKSVINLSQNSHASGVLYEYSAMNKVPFVNVVHTDKPFESNKDTQENVIHNRTDNPPSVVKIPVTKPMEHQANVAQNKNDVVFSVLPSNPTDSTISSVLSKLNKTQSHPILTQNSNTSKKTMQNFIKPYAPANQPIQPGVTNTHKTYVPPFKPTFGKKSKKSSTNSMALTHNLPQFDPLPSKRVAGRKLSHLDRIVSKRTELPKPLHLDPLSFFKQQMLDPLGIAKYLTDEYIQKVGPYECRRLDNAMKNYEALSFIGLAPPKPSFMQSTREKKLEEMRQDLERKREIREREKEDSDDSDEEWTPYMTKKRKVSAPRVTSARNRAASSQQKPTSTITSGALENSTESTSRYPLRPRTEPTSRYPLRASARSRTYMFLEVDGDDDFLYCEECNIEHPGDCPTHGPLTVVADKQVPKGTEDRAMKTLPDFLFVKMSNIPNSGRGVFTKTCIEIRYRFGPYEGDFVAKKEQAKDSGYSWQLRDGKKTHFVDAVNEMTSNWLRYVNCARTEDEQNLHAYQHKGQIYYRTYKPIPPGTELLVYYGVEYAKDLGIDRLLIMSVAGLVYRLMEVVDLERTTCTHSIAGTDCILPHKGTAIKCDMCILAFSDVKYLYLHKKYKHRIHYDTVAAKYPVTEQSGKNKKRHQCTVCEYSSDDSGSLKLHLRAHSGEKPFKCSLCKFVTIQAGNLKTHMLIHSGIRPHKCHQCSYSATRAVHLRTHIQTHSKERPFKCSQCEYSATQSNNLQRHMLAHSNEKRLMCSQCSYSCALPQQLQEHMYKHGGEMPHKCSRCPYTCVRPEQLQHHMYKHTGDMPHKCPQCPYACTMSSDLRKHMYTHSGQKPHKCSQCEYSCTQKGDLNKHIKRHHNIMEE